MKLRLRLEDVLTGQLPIHLRLLDELPRRLTHYVGSLEYQLHCIVFASDLWVLESGLQK
jgi:hypothetical protein